MHTPVRPSSARKVDLWQIWSKYNINKAAGLPSKYQNHQKSLQSELSSISAGLHGRIEGLVNGFGAKTVQIGLFRRFIVFCDVIRM